NFGKSHVDAIYDVGNGEKDDKIIAVCADDPEYNHYNDINKLPCHRLAEIRRFFEDYKKKENKEVAVNDILPASSAYKESHTTLHGPLWHLHCRILEEVGGILTNGAESNWSFPQ
ncbi:unnamed protein product, partial [Musa acuminata var. zebrina]